MLFDATQLKELQNLLESELGLKYKGEELKAAALAISRLVYAKELQKHGALTKEQRKEDEQSKT